MNQDDSVLPSFCSGQTWLYPLFEVRDEESLRLPRNRSIDLFWLTMEPLPQFVTIGSMIFRYMCYLQPREAKQRSKIHGSTSWSSGYPGSKNPMVVPVVPPGVADASAVQQAARSLRSWKYHEVPILAN